MQDIIGLLEFSRAKESESYIWPILPVKFLPAARLIFGKISVITKGNFLLAKISNHSTVIYNLIFEELNAQCVYSNIFIAIKIKSREYER